MRAFVFLLILWIPARASWWPMQKSPKAIVTARIKHAADMREMNLAQSVAGLAAQSLNEGTSNEGVWISTTNPNYKVFYQSLVKRLKAKELGEMDVWALVDRYKAKGIIKGYILYDFSRGDNSINLATIYAGLYKGILIDVTQEGMALNTGLKMLYDASKDTLNATQFKSLQSKLNPHLLVLANPAFSNNRDYAIAHKSMVYYGVDSLFESIASWVKPLSPVIGWNKGDEFKHIAPCSRWGLINTASDWCMNLSLLSIPSTEKQQKVRTIDPEKINWKEEKNYHAFVMSDGDNMQWTFGGFLNSKDYWANPYNKEIPMSFTTCILNLSMAARDVYDQLVKTQPAGTTVVEYGGGYYYPDLFGAARPDPEKLLRQYAAMINIEMKRTGTKVFGFICKDVASPKAQTAYRIFAEEIEDLTGMIAVQYSPYNGGHGQTFWFQNKKGMSIPVVAAKYQLWVNLDKEGSGGPAAVAGWINEHPSLDWTIVHAWSAFDHQRGVTPVKWAKDKINEGTKIVSVEELLWRIRMKHNAANTQKEI
ncbi:hypothetical protein GFS24_06815 [Chitinophaga sp. SYP-B3965]|uniref:GxGYxYP domain-containing protein n=1 Tax=Chitinophaga sp. SYP-B3965 TaxID=2663120 RepID=UPI0012999255|nr:GxGYxYP domain-containing protein [Chitinophaga sp. SYP-B3965]MRG44818.1 hypothetical protein [Chitinophaga sp. SYP-B3965]